MTLENDRDKLEPDEYSFRKSYFFAKRLTDMVLSLVLLVLLFPLIVVVAVGIKLSSPGPVFIRTLRIGRWGRPFNLYKFRTMVPTAVKKMRDIMASDEMSGPVFKIKDDPRITRIGRFLRKTSIDELPQLWNVLTGEMSLVGPRPALRFEVDALKGSSIRLMVKPGITGLWESDWRDYSFEGMDKADVEYCKNMSFWLDLKIIARTFRAVFHQEGAM